MASSIHRAAVASVLLLAAGPASARELGEWGPYVTADVGMTRFNVRKARLDDWSEVPSGASNLDRNDFGYSLAAGFRFSPHLAVEAAYLDMGRSSYLVEDKGGVARLGFRSRGAAAAVLGAWPINHTLTLEGRAGLYLGKSKLKLRDSVSASPDAWLEGTGGGNPALLLGTGIALSSGAHWAVRLGYDYLNGNAIAIRNPDLDAGMDSSAGRLSLGIRYLF